MWPFRRKPDPSALALLAAKQERLAAWLAYDAAKERGDTREMNRTHKLYRLATSQVIRAEIGQCG